MRKVPVGNTLPDLAVCKGDVVYYDSPSFEKRGDAVVIFDVLCDAAGMPVDYTGVDGGEVFDLDFDSPYWHVVAYSAKGQSMIDAVVSTPGVQGYSTPTPDHVIFNISEDVYELVCTSEAWTSLVSEHMQYGTGSWRGVIEASYALPRAVYDEMQRRWPFIMHDQEAVLILGTPESQNWRPATLLYRDGTEVDIGTWLEVTEAVAKSQDSYSMYNGKYFAVLRNPPEDAETALEQLRDQKIALLDRTMARISAMSTNDMEQHGLGVYWETWCTFDLLENMP